MSGSQTERLTLFDFVGAGSGFVPADAPYAYTAGPEGIEILEFRHASAFDMVIT
ncbi:MAG: hypothetical protein QOF40_1033, partial [Actinomycetota bacterium]|nr:hypothetical protein [Actinomycetota bacterium]